MNLLILGIQETLSFILWPQIENVDVFLLQSIYREGFLEKHHNKRNEQSWKSSSQALPSSHSTLSELQFSLPTPNCYLLPGQQVVTPYNKKAMV